MTCTEFKQWFQDHESDQMSHEIRQHLTTCDGCRQIYELDRILETKLKNNFEQCDVPQRLLERLEQNKSGNNLWLVQPYVLRRVIAPMLAIAALFVVFLFPFSSENSSFASMDILGELAIHDHLSHGTKGCSISGINDIGSWALKELGYRVVLPETPEGSELLVVSKCRLGDCETVHLI